MSILSTNKKLISLAGTEYSAGQGIDITNHVISVVESAVGTNYSAGPNINIYDDEGQPTISSKDWSSEIADASANAYEQAIAQIPEPQDLSYLSGKIDTNTSGIDYISSVCITAHKDWTDTIKGASSYSYEQSTSYFDNWVEGQYTGDITNITNKITALSGDFGDYYKKTETSSKDEINDALQYVSANAGKVYEGVSPIVVNNTEDKISADTWTFSAGSNVSFVDDNVNKITRIDVELPTPQDLSYISAQTDKANQGVDYLSGVVITALPSDMATTGDVAELAQTISETYYPNTNPSSFVNEDWVTAQGYITGVDLSEYAERAFVLSSIESATSGKLDVSSFASVSSDFLTNEDLDNYYTKSETSGADQLADAFANIPAGDVGVNTYVQNNSATINEVNTTFQSNSSNYITAHQSLDGYATEDWVTGQGYLTGVSIPESATWNDVSETVQTNSAQWAEGGSGDEEVNELVHTNSATWNEVTNKLDTTAQVVTGFTTATIEGTNAINSLNGKPIISWRTQSAQEAGIANNARYDYEGNNLVDDHNSLTSLKDVVQSNSSQWANGGAISSYTSAWSTDVPPYGGYVIDSLNGKYLSAYISRSAANAATAHIADLAIFAQTVDENKLENDGFVKNLSSEYGTISVVHNNIIESTNSAISRVGNEGFVSSFQEESIGPTVTANFSWDKSLPNTTFNFTEVYASPNTPIYYSANTNLTGVVSPTSIGEIPFSIEVPNATALDIWSNAWIQIKDNVASASDSFETVVGELAWASALPTYEYDNTNKISAINGSALAGGSEIPTGTMNVSGLEYNAVGEISAYGNSAIAQYGAEKQWLVHDDTIVHISNSAQYALGVAIDNVARLMGVDETVLWENSEGGRGTLTLSDNCNSYDRLRVYWDVWNQGDYRRNISELDSSVTKGLLTATYFNTTNNAFFSMLYTVSLSGTSFSILGNRYNNWTNNTVTDGGTNSITIYKIVGIGRKDNT